MHIKKEEVGDITIFRITGKILLGEGDEVLREAVDDFLQNGGNKLLLDLKNVPYLDGGGAVEILRAFTAICRSDPNCAVKLMNLNNRVYDFFKITKLVSTFEIYNDENEAIRSFNAR